MAGTKTFEVAPSAARLTGSLRDIGYDFPTAVADLVDNSIAAGASRINVYTQFEPQRLVRADQRRRVGHDRSASWSRRCASAPDATTARTSWAVRAGPQDRLVLAVPATDGGHSHGAEASARST